MLHPITHEFLSKAKEQDRSRQRAACQWRNSVQASRSAGPSQNRNRVDRLRTLLLHAARRLGKAMIALRTRERETSGRMVTGPNIQEQAHS